MRGQSPNSHFCSSAKAGQPPRAPSRAGARLRSFIPVEAGTMILVAGALLATALGASLLAGRLRVPGLVAFLGIGMAVGSDGFGWIDFSDYELARDIGIV